jgi:dihydrofolate synthase/folylpolyglutamate synthase
MRARVAEAYRFLESLQGRGIRPGLSRMRALLRAGGHPERKVPSAIVAGTNGKGSTAATLASILESAGLRAGLYTSPHLVDLRERWRIGGESIPDHDLFLEIEAFRQIAERSSLQPTYFEALTFIAFSYFARRSCDIVVLEVGLGGRLDATNVTRPLVAAITSIGRDHMEYLGSTLEEIAREKAGVIHRGSQAVTSNSEGPVLEVIRARCAAMNAPLHVLSAETEVSQVVLTDQETSFRLRTPEGLYELVSPLAGRHQIPNIASAVRTAELLSTRFPSLRPEAMKEGVRGTFWRGRMERFELGDCTIWVDGGHNANALVEVVEFARRFIAPPLLLLFGMMRDKDVGEAAALLFPHFDSIIATSPDPVRGMPPEELERYARQAGRDFTSIPDPAEAVRSALGRGFHHILICGSLYLAGTAVEVLDGLGARSSVLSPGR